MMGRCGQWRERREGGRGEERQRERREDDMRDRDHSGDEVEGTLRSPIKASLPGGHLQLSGCLRRPLVAVRQDGGRQAQSSVPRAAWQSSESATRFRRRHLSVPAPSSRRCFRDVRNPFCASREVPGNPPGPPGIQVTPQCRPCPSSRAWAWAAVESALDMGSGCGERKSLAGPLLRAPLSPENDPLPQTFAEPAWCP